MDGKRRSAAVAHRIQIAGLDIQDPKFTRLNNKPYKAAAFPKTFSYTRVGDDRQLTAAIETKLRSAIQYVCEKSAKHSDCNDYFKTLSQQKSLAQILTEAPILLGALVPLNGDPNDGSLYTELPSGNTAGRQIIINLMEVVGLDVIDIAGTLVHELAHIGGATTDKDEFNPHSLDAEMALKHCMLVNQFHPGALGLLRGRSMRRTA